MKRTGWGNYLWIIGTGVIAVLILIVGVLAWNYHKLKNDPAHVAKTDTARVLQKVGAIYDLPTNEQPTVAQVQDKAKLQGQAFFDKAQNGDYVLVYANNKLALLYREQSNKLINVGPVSFQNNTAQSQQSPQVSPAETTKH